MSVLSEDPFQSSGDDFSISKLEKMELDVSEEGDDDDDTDGSLFDSDSFADFDVAAAAAVTEAAAVARAEKRAAAANAPAERLAAEQPAPRRNRETSTAGTENEDTGEDSEDDELLSMDPLAPVSPTTSQQLEHARAAVHQRDQTARRRSDESKETETDRDDESDSSGYIQPMLGTRNTSTFARPEGQWQQRHSDNVASLQQNQSTTIQELTACVDALQQQKKLDNDRIAELSQSQGRLMRELDSTRKKLEQEASLAQQMLTYANDHREMWKTEKESIGQEVTRLQELLTTQQQVAREQAAEIEDRHRRFRETTTESFQTQISALREELQASRREHDMQVLALERKAAADKQAVIAESKQRVQLLGRTADAERATIEQELRTEIMRLTQQNRVDAEKSSTTLQESTRAFQAELDRQQQQIGALQEQLAKAGDQVGLAERLRLEEARKSFKVREHGKVLELQAQLAETKCSELERKFEQEVKRRQLLGAQLTSGGGGDSKNLRDENSQLHLQVQALEKQVEELLHLKQVGHRQYSEEPRKDSAQPNESSSHNAPIKSRDAKERNDSRHGHDVLELFDSIGEGVEELLKAAQADHRLLLLRDQKGPMNATHSSEWSDEQGRTDPMALETKVYSERCASVHSGVVSNDDAAYFPDDERDAFARHHGYEDVDDSAHTQLHPAQFNRGQTAAIAGEYILASKAHEYIRHFQEKAQVLAARIVLQSRVAALRTIFHSTVSRQQLNVRRAWYQWVARTSASRSQEMSRLRTAIGEIETQMVAVYSTANRKESELRAELKAARLAAASLPGAVSLFEAGSRRVETSAAVFVQLQRFIGMQQEHNGKLRDAVHLLLRSMMHLLRMNGKLESVFEPLLLHARPKLKRAQGAKLDRNWQKWKDAQVRMRDGDMRAFMSQLSRVEGNQRKRCQAFYLTRLDQIRHFHLLRRQAAAFRHWHAISLRPVDADDVANLWGQTTTGSHRGSPMRPRFLQPAAAAAASVAATSAVQRRQREKALHKNGTSFRGRDSQDNSLDSFSSSFSRGSDRAEGASRQGSPTISRGNGQFERKKSPNNLGIGMESFRSPKSRMEAEAEALAAADAALFDESSLLGDTSPETSPTRLPAPYGSKESLPRDRHPDDDDLTRTMRTSALGVQGMSQPISATNSLPAMHSFMTEPSSAFQGSDAANQYRSSGGMHDLLSVSVTKEPPPFRNSVRKLESAAQRIFERTSAGDAAGREKMSPRRAGDQDVDDGLDLDFDYAGNKISDGHFESSGNGRRAGKSTKDTEDTIDDGPVIPPRQSVVPGSPMISRNDAELGSGGEGMARAVAAKDAADLDASLEEDFRAATPTPAADSGTNVGAIAETPGGGLRYSRGRHDSYASASASSDQQVWAASLMRAGSENGQLRRSGHYYDQRRTPAASGSENQSKASAPSVSLQVPRL